MQILDGEGRVLREVTAQLTGEEITDLLVAASKIDDGSQRRAVLTDASGMSFSLLIASQEDVAEPRARSVQVGHMDWWLGPILLLAVILMAVGAFTVARGLLGLLF